MDFATLKTELNIRLGDTDNFTFTIEEKTSNLTEAFNDSDVVKIVWNDTLTYAQNTFQYAKPSGVDKVLDIYIKRSSSSNDEPEKIASDLWEVVDSNIHFKHLAHATIPEGATLYIKGYTKYTISDTVTETNLQEFILNLAQLKCLKMLGIKKALRFLKNDTSMAEVVAIKRELEREVQMYRQRLPREFEVA